MSLMRKERKSEYEHWTVGPGGAPVDEAVDPERIELEKLRQLEALKWVLEDLVDELREIRNRLPPQGIGQRVK